MLGMVGGLTSVRPKTVSASKVTSTRPILPKTTGGKGFDGQGSWYPAKSSASSHAEHGSGESGSGMANMPWLLDEIKKWSTGGYGMSDDVKNGMIDAAKQRMYETAYGADYNPDTAGLNEGGKWGGLFKTMTSDMNRRGMFQSGLVTEEQGKINNAVMKDLSQAQRDADMQQFNTNQSSRQFGLGAANAYRSGDITLAGQAMQQQMMQQQLAQAAQQAALDRALTKYGYDQQASSSSAAGWGGIAGDVLQSIPLFGALFKKD